MMEAGIEIDRNYLVEEVHHFSDCEAYQRSKCLSHNYQRERRQDAVKKARPHECLKNQLNNITLDHLYECYVDELKGFIHVRKFDLLKIPRHLKFKWPLKGDVEKAVADETNLLSLALEFHKSTNYF